jgi:two-component system, LuxR family, response regulator FixJ
MEGFEKDFLYPLLASIRTVEHTMTLLKDPVVVKIIEDDELVQNALSEILKQQGYHVESYTSATDFQQSDVHQDRTIYLIDLRLGIYNGMDLVDSILRRNPLEVVIITTSFGGLETGADAIKHGAFDVLEKPFTNDTFIRKIEAAVLELQKRTHDQKNFNLYEETMNKLSFGEKKVFEYLLKGTANKVIASELNVSLRTIELRRAKLLKSFGVGSLAELVSLHCMVAKAAPPFIQQQGAPDFFPETPLKGVM